MLRRAARAALVLPAALLLLAGSAVPAQAVEVRGAIYDKWLSLGGTPGFLGAALTDEAPTARGGAYNVFERGLILWTQPTGAHFIRGAVRQTWTQHGSEFGFLGFPTIDEAPSARGGAVQLFEGGSVYWSSSTGAHELIGGIRDAWSSQGYEAGPLGFPRTGEFAIQDGTKQEFEGGNIVWTPTGGAVIAYPPAPINLPPVQAYANCDQLRAASPFYAHGIGRPGAVDSNGNPPVTNFLVDQARYDAQSEARDADDDGIACEQN